MRRLIILMAAVSLLLSCSKPEDYLVIIHTPYGDMKAVLFDETPKHKENFFKLAKDGSFDSTIFHRVIENFMIQGGDVNAKPNGAGGVNYTLPAEIQLVPEGRFLHTKGAIAAARQGDNMNPDKESSGCQFYIVDGQKFTKEQLTLDQTKLNVGMRQLLQEPEYAFVRDTLVNLQQQGKMEELNAVVASYKAVIEEKFGIDVSLKITDARLKAYTEGEGSPHLDKGYTVFGRVVEGLEVIDKIAAVKTGTADKPVENVYMTVELEPIKKKEIAKKYGLEFPVAKK